MTNFTQCAARYMHNASLIAQWNYSGPVHSIDPNQSTQITLEGCKAVCGTGSDLYPWSQSSSTITTWILPVIGILLQAPFESNAFWRTLLAIVRWIGSPMASLSYILWNINVTGKCALIVDMSVTYHESPSEESNFASMRDSMYILMNMNQYTMKPVAMKKEAEGLLRIVLFSRDLRLRDTSSSLREVRRQLAWNLRHGRRKGVVPVFISTMWFLFSLAISIQGAFGLIGENATAHDLALGLLISWLPVLILCCIVDRNPIAADDIRMKLNHLIDHVCLSLQDDQIRKEFLESFAHRPEREKMQSWVDRITRHADFIRGEFFVDFAGQGRVRWHYGAAHPILCDIEKCYVAERGRNWLANEVEARNNLVLGDVDEGLLWFDLRELWQITAAIAIVTLTIMGAFVLSYYTPTVGLGCRSGGYMIFGVTAFTLLIAELLVWWLTDDQQTQWLEQHLTRLQSTATFNVVESRSRSFRESFNVRRKSAATAVESAFIKAAVTVIHPFHWGSKAQLRHSISDNLETLHDFTLRQWAHCVFVLIELFNAIWILWIVLAQTFGVFVNCECQCSVWSHMGGYMDLAQWDFTQVASVTTYWRLGTILSTTAMGLGMIYIVIEWCLQSHLSTTSYQESLRGLRRTRQFRRLTYPLRYPIILLTNAINSLKIFICCCGKGWKPTPRTLVWTYHTHYRPTGATPAPVHPPSPRSPYIGTTYSPHSPGEELQLSPFKMTRMDSAGADDALSARPLIREPSSAQLSLSPSEMSRTRSWSESERRPSQEGLGITTPDVASSPVSDRGLLSPMDAARDRRGS